MSSGITLSAGVRQNLLSLQATADMMATTQNRLATGKKVNSALDNPSNFFTSQSLSDRAGDLNSLLDSIGQAVKTLDAANNGITSLTKLGSNNRAASRQCAAPINNVKSWNVSGKQLTLYDESGSALARLYSSGPEKFDGQTSSGLPISLTR